MNWNDAKQKDVLYWNYWSGKWKLILDFIQKYEILIKRIPQECLCTSIYIQIKCSYWKRNIFLLTASVLLSRGVAIGYLP